MLQFTPREAGSKRMVIVGCGGLGASVATTLSEAGHTLHILNPEREAFDRLPAGPIADGHIVPLIGGGRLQRDLLNAAVQDADVFMALTDSDSENALAAQMAKLIYRVPLVICRIDDPTIQGMYGGLGIVAISATALVAQMALEKAGA
mgnify:CR=1 FL=1